MNLRRCFKCRRFALTMDNFCKICGDKLPPTIDLEQAIMESGFEDRVGVSFLTKKVERCSRKSHLETAETAKLIYRVELRKYRSGKRNSKPFIVKYCGKCGKKLPKVT